MSMVRYSDETLPEPTERSKAELHQLASQPDSEIDCSDIPPLDAEFWENAVRGRFYRPVKQAVSVRIDLDVLEWLKQQGKGYQTRINHILRDTMLRSRRLLQDEKRERSH